jgi:hypothetical protein
MGATNPWWFLSAGAFLVGIVWLALSAVLGGLLWGRVAPLLTETRAQIQDLGDQAAHTVGQAGETMELIEARVSETMGQATQAGVSASRQAIGVGSVVAGIYVVSRLGGMIRAQLSRRSGRRSRRR